jgi:lipoprotein-anchoring transpeptidase ErfK/SrfK
MIPHKLLIFLSPAFLLFTSCSSFVPQSAETVEALPTENETTAPEFVNPFPEGTYDHFRAEPNYRKTYNVYRNRAVLNSMTPETAKLQINISDQRAQLLSNGQVAIDYPVATGRSSYPTPSGDFEILEKMVDKRSNAYGKVLDASGNVVNSDADASDPVPEGGKFLGASMPYWMRFTWTGIGHHIGNVPRSPASHGCIRGKRSTIPQVFSKVKVGTPVTILP